MTPLFALLLRCLPRPLAWIALGLCYGVLLVAVLAGAGRVPQEFIYL